METYKFTLRGITPLLMHDDNVLFSNTNSEQEARDDRFPAWTWQTHIFRYGNRVAMPIDNVIACLHKAGQQIAMSANKTSESEPSSAIRIHGMEVDHVSSAYLRFTIGSQEIAFDKIDALRHGTFVEQLEAVRKFGFDLHVKHDTVGVSNHVRIRPIFSNWTVNGVAEITAPEQVSFESMQELFDIAGSRVGLGDWFPCSKKSFEKYGKFECSWVKEKTALEKLHDEIKEVREEIKKLNMKENPTMHLAGLKMHLEENERRLQQKAKREEEFTRLLTQRDSQTCPNPNPALFKMPTIRNNSEK